MTAGPVGVQLHGSCKACRQRFAIVISDAQNDPPLWKVGRIKRQGAELIKAYNEVHSKFCLGSIVVPETFRGPPDRR